MTVLEELAQFPFVTYLDDVQLSDGLINGGINCALVVACSDMGMKLPYVCSSSGTNLLIVQNFGSVASQAGMSDLLVDQHVSDLIVYGHSDCQFARCVARSHRQTAAVQRVLSKYFKSHCETMMRQYGSNLSEDDHANWRKLSEWNALNELKTALINPTVFQRAESGRLRLHAWVYDREGNSLNIFDPRQRSFVPITTSD